MTTIFRLPGALRLTALLSTRPVSRFSRLCFSTSINAWKASGTIGRSYEDAIRLLDSLQSNRAVVSSISNTPRDMNLDAIPEMLDWTRKAGYNVADFSKNGLKCVHVAGTKGKGSVCVMVENILLQYREKDGGEGLGKIGLYTSPHLVHVRERIRIDGTSISEPMFTRYFFDLWDRFSNAASEESHPNPDSADTKPGYFRYLTILAFHIFMKEGVGTVIVECGIGGEYDSTNILPPDAVSVSAITSLGIDHVGMLGDTIEKIAWHKAGIMKPGVPTYTVVQLPEAGRILEERATEKGSSLAVVGRSPALQTVCLNLDGDFQQDNASLAIAVASAHLRRLGLIENDSVGESTEFNREIPEKFVVGLETVSWPGRCQIIEDGNTTWYIDGAHTEKSIAAAATWFAANHRGNDKSRKPTETMLIFNQQDRDAAALLRTLITQVQIAPKPILSARPFTYAAFPTNVPFKSNKRKPKPDLDLQNSLAQLYKQLTRRQLYATFGSIEEAVDLAHKVSTDQENVAVFVTGSLYLVGGLLEVLDAKKTYKISKTVEK